MAPRRNTAGSSKKDRKKFENNRLEFIKKRHHELVLKPRYSIAEDLDGEPDDEMPHFDVEQEHYRAVRDVCDLDSV